MCNIVCFMSFYASSYRLGLDAAFRKRKTDQLNNFGVFKSAPDKSAKDHKETYGQEAQVRETRCSETHGREHADQGQKLVWVAHW